MGKVERDVYVPDAERARAYDRLYAEYVELHDYFGRGGNDVLRRLAPQPPRGAGAVTDRRARPAARSTELPPRSSSATARRVDERQRLRPRPRRRPGGDQAERRLLRRADARVHGRVRPRGRRRRGRPRPVQRHRRALLRLPRDARGRRRRPHPQRLRDRLGRPGRGDPLRADRHGRRVRRPDPGRPVRADRRRRHRAGHGGHAVGSSLARRAHARATACSPSARPRAPRVKAAVMCEDVARTVHLARAFGDVAPLEQPPSTRSTSATRTSTASTEDRRDRARTDSPHRRAGHHAGALRRDAARASPSGRGLPGRARDDLEGVAECVVEPPARNRADIERVVGEFERQELDGVLIVNAHLRARPCAPPGARAGPAAAVPGQRPARAAGHRRVGHGGHDLQPGHPRRAGHRERDGPGGRPFDVVTEDWQAPAFRDRIGRWARAAAAVTAWRSLKVARVRLRDERHGRHPLRRELAAARARPEDQRDRARATCTARWPPSAARGGRRCARFEDERFEIDPRLSDAERDDHARMQVASSGSWTERGYEAFSTHFDAIGEDGRFARLPFAAASSLMAKGYGFAGEGDAADRRARPRRARADRRRALHRDVRDGLPRRTRC